MEQRAFDHESRLSHIEGLLEGLQQRIDEAVLTQIRDHGKRLKELECHVANISEHCATERGKQSGIRATLMMIIGVISSIGGVVGSLVGRFL